MTSQPIDNGNGKHTLVWMEQFFSQWLIDLEKFLAERDRRYEEKFSAIEKAREAAFLSQKQLTDAAFASAQKAVDKAEEAQKEYNKRSNEFRQALDDANKGNIPRPEYQAGHKTLIDRMDAETLRIQEKFEEVKESIEELRISKANISGKHEQSKADSAFNFSVASLIGTIIVAIGVIVTLIKAFVK
jgi:Plant specific mitochondrial import receptor subunit TOM20